MSRKKWELKHQTIEWLFLYFTAGITTHSWHNKMATHVILLHADGFLSLMRVTAVLIPTPVPVHVWDLVVPTLCSPTPRITIKQGGTKTVSMNNLISSFVYFPVEMGGRSSHVSWIYIYLCNRYISPFSLWVETPIQWQVVLQSRFCDMWQIGVFLRTFFSTKTTDRHRVLHSYVLCMYHVYSHSTHWLVNNLLLSIDEYLILLNFIIICK